MAVSLDMRLPRSMSTRVDPGHAASVIGLAYGLNRPILKPMGMALLVGLNTLLAASLHFVDEAIGSPRTARVESAPLVQPPAGAQE
jgi:hypothetical protein